MLAAACGPVLPVNDASFDTGAPDAGALDAGVPDAGAFDAGSPDAGDPDSGSFIVSPRDAGSLIVDSGLPWSWSLVRALLATPPSDGGVHARWVDIVPYAVDRAWAGGVLLFDGGVVAIPFNEGSVLVIHPSDDTFQRWPVAGGAVAEGWQGGVLLPDGTVIGIPRNASKFLRIDPATGSVTLFGDDLSDAGVDGGLDKFRGGVLGLNGLVYAAPSTADFIARLDPSTGVVTRLPLPPPQLRGSTHGAVLFPTGDIVMFPSADTPGLLIVPSRTGGPDAVWLLARPMMPGGTTAFAGGGVITGLDTALAPPQQNASPLRYGAGLFAWLPAVDGLTLQTANAYFFGAWSTEGHLYSPGFASEPVLRFDAAGSSSLVSLDAGVYSFRSVFGAVGLPDGRIIAIPHGRSAWLELAPEGRVLVPMEAMTSPFLNKL